MKKQLIITLLAVAGLIILIQSGTLESLLLFLLIGSVPGTNYSLPPTVMLILIATIALALVTKFASSELLAPYKRHKATLAKTAHKNRMPKRRFGQI